MSIEGRRAINLAIISYALVLARGSALKGLATRVRESMTKRVHEAQFGSREDCESLMVAIAQALVAVKSRTGFAPQIKTCVEQLKQVGQCRSDSTASRLQTRWPASCLSRLMAKRCLRCQRRRFLPMTTEHLQGAAALNCSGRDRLSVGVSSARAAPMTRRTPLIQVVEPFIEGGHDEQ